MLLEEDFVTTHDLNDIMTFWNELTMPYEERQKRERQAANEAINDFVFDKKILESLSNNEEEINLKDWNF